MKPRILLLALLSLAIGNSILGHCFSVMNISKGKHKINDAWIDTQTLLCGKEKMHISPGEQEEKFFKDCRGMCCFKSKVELKIDGKKSDFEIGVTCRDVYVFVLENKVIITGNKHPHATGEYSSYGLGGLGQAHYHHYNEYGNPIKNYEITKMDIPCESDERNFEYYFDFDGKKVGAEKEFLRPGKLIPARDGGGGHDMTCDL